jgi:hypothetical protein
MRKHVVTLVLALGVGILGFAVSGIAVAGNNNPPPGQGECGHGNSDNKPCKDDPQPDKGRDCEEHGNSGGVNEDHCNGETTPTETTPTETTTTETTETTTTESTTTETTSTETTPTGTTPTETTPSQASSEPAKNEETTATVPATVADEADSTESKAPSFVGTPPVAEAKKKPAAVRDAVVSPSKPTRAPQQAPFSR